MKTKPNTVLPKGARLIKPRLVKCGTWNAQLVDAKVTRLGLVWYRVKGGFSNRGDREDWIADVKGASLCVNDYHWNGEDFGPSYGSFDAAIIGQVKVSLQSARYSIAEKKRELKERQRGLQQLKKALCTK